jgi:hypothetical protein
VKSETGELGVRLRDPLDFDLGYRRMRFEITE